MVFVNRSGGVEKQEDVEASGQPIDFDPADDSVVKVHYDLAMWTFEQRADLSEALAEATIPHAWDGEELLVPEAVEEAADAMFDHLEAQIGPFPIALGDDEDSTEFGLDEWTDADRAVLTEAMVESEIPYRWEGVTVVVARDAEDAVDDLLDAIEAGELMSADSGSETTHAPEGVLGEVFLLSNRLAKDPFDAKARTELIDLRPNLDAAHPPYAFAPRTWSQVVDKLDVIGGRIMADAGGDRSDASASDERDRLEQSSDIIGLAQELRSLVRPYV